MGAQSPSCDILPNDGIALLATSDLADAEAKRAWAARVGGGGFGLEKGRWKSRKPPKSILDIVSKDSDCTLMPVSVVSCRLLAL